jgi:hypothetical protein
MGKERISEALKKENLEISKEHYRRIKKHIKKVDKIDRLRWGI